jgi:hypothetical protein
MESLHDRFYHDCYKNLKILPIFQAKIKVLKIEDGEIP